MSAPDRDESLFPELTPPPGGLAALRARIAHDEQRRTRRFYRYAAFAPAAAACALLVLLLLPKEQASPAPQLDGVVAARLGLEPLPVGVEVTSAAGTRLTGVTTSSSATVDVVWIGAGK